jgi:hypothetical protein
MMGRRSPTQAELPGCKLHARADTEGHCEEIPRLREFGQPSSARFADLQNVLTNDEVLLSFYFGRFDSFVWILGKNGPVQFRRINTTLGNLNSKVSKLRELSNQAQR